VYVLPFLSLPVQSSHRYNEHLLSDSILLAHAEQITGDIIATRVPGDVVADTIEPDGRRSFAAINEDPEKLHTYTETSITDDDRYPAPTQEESTTLRKVAGKLPFISYALCLVEFAERASYYGVQTIFNNFIEFPLPAGKFTESNSSSFSNN
jgi:hypothetical protein